MRRRRSLLFTPGTQPERIKKALLAGVADVVVADLEDAVAPHDKIEARIAVRNVLLDTAEAPAERAVRINAWPSGWAEEDLEVVLAARPDLVLVPKAHDVDALHGLVARITAGEQDLRLPPGSIRVAVLIETAAGVLRAADLAAVSPRIEALCFGAEDLAADAGMRRTASNQEVAVPRALVALAAAAQGRQAIDMITADYKDTDRARREAEEARGLGYAGKMVIHPDQVAPVHAGFAPTDAERSWAAKVLAAVDADEVGDGGVVVVDDKMIDRPLVEQARRIARDADG